MTATPAVNTKERGSPPVGGWRVMVVEDNRAVAALHKRIVNSVPHLRTAHIALNGEHAFAALATVQPDLVILDLTMSGGDGVSFLRRVREECIPVDVIVVTASRDGRTVREMMHLGVIDYLVKPFRPERLRQSLDAFTLRRRTLSRRSELSQDDVDLLQTTGSTRQRRRLPMGLKEETLRAVLGALAETAYPLSAEEVGEEIGMARVTARRYLEFLECAGAAEIIRETRGPGRPRNRYRRRVGPHE
jgi:two-component system, CitB family, response regulator DctR